MSHAPDGGTLQSGYLPGAELELPPGVRLHREVEELDPIAFEVIRYKLWNATLENGEAMKKVSGSPVTIFVEDYNSALLTEDGEYVYIGPWNSLQSGVVDFHPKWILENLGGSPGIHDGDMFLSNDVWVGSVHALDTILTCPVIWEDEIFCWVANVAHQMDLGGTAPGSFVPDAPDRFSEAVPFPPLKVVEGGEIRPDIEHYYLRHSRMPEFVALELRAQVAGNQASRQRILSFLERYGPAAVKGAMKRIVDSAEESFVRRLDSLPDGQWSDTSFVEAATVGDRGTYQVSLNLTKQGRSLSFDNEGTDPQVGVLSVSHASWRSGILAVVGPLMCNDVLFSIGGALRHIEFASKPGTITSAVHPSPTSNSSIGCLISRALATSCLSRMIVCDGGERHEAFAPGGVSQWPISTFSGLTEGGAPFGGIYLDVMGGSIGAFDFRDGIASGGVDWVPRSLMPNVEYSEQYYPLLYLYRRELQDSGGAGRFRGGNGVTWAVVPHGAESVDNTFVSSGVAIPTSKGLFGGYPGATNSFRLKRGTDVLERFAAGTVPDRIEALAGELTLIAPKQLGVAQGPGDVLEEWISAGGGWGDPLDREPAAVAADVASGAIGAAAADSIFGVALSEDGWDEEATSAERARRRAGRFPGAGERPADGPPGLRFAGGEIRCGRCDQLLAADREELRATALVRRLPVAATNPLILDPGIHIDETIEWMEFGCPGCGALLDGDLIRNNEAPTTGFRLGKAAKRED
jgi:N-methylhydantoinase B